MARRFATRKYSAWKGNRVGCMNRDATDPVWILERQRILGRRRRTRT